MSNPRELNSRHKVLFELCREAIIDDYKNNESVQEKKVRMQKFRTLYDKHVKVSGHVVRESWTMNHDQGFQPPQSLHYKISIKGNNWKKVKYHPHLIIKKSTIATQPDGTVTNQELFRQSGYGVFAAKDFEAGEYIGPFLGEVKAIKKHNEDNNSESESRTKRRKTKKSAGADGKDMYNSSYSLQTENHLVDPKGSFWSHWFFGLHLINDPRERRKVNVEADSNLRFFATRNIKAGEELFLNYGPGFWNRMRNEL